MPQTGRPDRNESLVLQGAFSGCSPRTPLITVLGAVNQDCVLNLSCLEGAAVYECC